MPSDDRKKLVKELLQLIKGKVLAIAMKHDASRVVQTALQFGTQEVWFAVRVCCCYASFSCMLSSPSQRSMCVYSSSMCVFSFPLQYQETFVLSGDWLPNTHTLPHGHIITEEYTRQQLYNNALSMELMLLP